MPTISKKRDTTKVINQKNCVPSNMVSLKKVKVEFRGEATLKSGRLFVKQWFANPHSAFG